MSKKRLGAEQIVTKLRQIEVLQGQGVRRQSFLDSERRRLREALARLADDVRRLADDAASVGLRWSVV
jgi:hypothetical protein